MISEEKMAQYRATLRARHATAVAQLDQQFAQAHEIAKQLAAILYQEFNAEQVYLFGSLTDRTQFHSRSDIDLAAWGIEEKRYLAAVAAVTRQQAMFSVDLVRLEEASERMQQTVATHGIPL
jgi:uncharacterized protein